MLGSSSDVLLCGFGKLLGDTVHVAESGVCCSNGVLDCGNGAFRTSRGRLGSLFQHAGNGFLEVAELGFNHLGQFLLGLGSDFVHRTRVGNSLLDSRLGQRGLGGQGSLRVLGAHHGLDAGNGVFQRGAGGVQVQGSDALGRSQGGVGNRQQGINGSFVGSGELFGIDGHVCLQN